MRLKLYNADDLFRGFFAEGFLTESIIDRIFDGLCKSDYMVIVFLNL